MLTRAPAQGRIVEDQEEFFFDQVTALDVRHQYNISPIGKRDLWLRQYRDSLRAEVLEFSPAEREDLRRVFERLHTLVSSRLPGLWPDSIALAKIAGRAYGDHAFFTRGHTIMIPAAQLEYHGAEALAPVLLHEVWHLISRAHRDRRAHWYRSVGFVRPPAPLEWPAHLAAARLLNPDGIDGNWLLVDGQPSAVPYVYTTEAPEASSPSYFAALQWAYLPVRQSDSRYKVTDHLDLALSRATVQQLTGGNTDYLLHPDEIMAENFIQLFAEELGLPPAPNPQTLERARQALTN